MRASKIKYLYKNLRNKREGPSDNPVYLALLTVTIENSNLSKQQQLSEPIDYRDSRKTGPMPGQIDFFCV